MTKTLIYDLYVIVDGSSATAEDPYLAVPSEQEASFASPADNSYYATNDFASPAANSYLAAAESPVDFAAAPAADSYLPATEAPLAPAADDPFPETIDFTE